MDELNINLLPDLLGDTLDYLRKEYIFPDEGGIAPGDALWLLRRYLERVAPIDYERMFIYAFLTLGKRADELVYNQLDNDFIRWGATWRKRDIGNQDERILARWRDYYDQYVHGGYPIPWAKICGHCHIAIVRKRHPEFLVEDV